MNNKGSSRPTGDLIARKISTRRPTLAWLLSNVLRLSFLKGWFAVHVQAPIASFFGALTAFGKVEAVHYHFASKTDSRIWEILQGKLAEAEALGNLDLAAQIQDQITMLEATRERINYGVLSYRAVTTAFVTFLVDQLQTETSVFGDFKFHDSGVGTTAENVTDTAMETTDGESRATGTQTESAANAYRSVATISYTTTKAITEHGLFNDASAGTLMDRSVFSAINVINGDSIQFTYTFTVSAGG